MKSRSQNVPTMVAAYDVIIRNCVASYVELSFSVDVEVFKQANKAMISRFISTK